MNGLCCWRRKEEKKYEDIMENTEVLRHSTSRTMEPRVVVRQQSNILKNSTFELSPAIVVEDPATPLAARMDEAGDAEFGPRHALISASHSLAETADRTELGGGVEPFASFLASPGSSPPGPASPPAADWSGLEHGSLRRSPVRIAPHPPAGGRSPSLLPLQLQLHTAASYRSRHVTSPESDHNKSFPANFVSTPSDHQDAATEADASHPTLVNDQSVLPVTTPSGGEGGDTTSVTSPSPASFTSSVGSSLDINVDNIKAAAPAPTSPRRPSVTSPDPQGAIAQELESLWHQETGPEPRGSRFPHVANLASLRAPPSSPDNFQPSPAVSVVAEPGLLGIDV